MLLASAVDLAQGCRMRQAVALHPARDAKRSKCCLRKGMHDKMASRSCLAACRDIMRRVAKALGRAAVMVVLAGATFLVYRLLTLVPAAPGAL